MQKAVAIDDDRFAEAYYLLGLCFRDAQESRRRAQRVDVEAGAGDGSRARACGSHGRLGRLNERMAELEALVSLDPGPRRQGRARAAAYVRAGDFDRAVTTLGGPPSSIRIIPTLRRARARGWKKRSREATGWT